ncbi:MAG: hypothetical protein MH472_08780 [Bacteroidia bacterium]|nr:hypothetical protein [Bacteroidia bacterium]
MKKIIFGLFMVSLITSACSTFNGNKALKTPFRGNAYESNRRYFRSVASGESINLETAKSKAMLTATQRIAASVQTEIKNVTENYTNERNIGGNLGDFGERFQQLTREVMSTQLMGATLHGEKVYQQTDKTYQVWVAMEVRKRELYKRLKEKALQNNNLTEAQRKAVSEMIDKQIEELDDK